MLRSRVSCEAEGCCEAKEKGKRDGGKGQRNAGWGTGWDEEGVERAGRWDPMGKERHNGMRLGRVVGSEGFEMNKTNEG